MATRYNPKETEPKWRAAWERAQVFRAKSAKDAKGMPKAYVLEMFPYPSGRLHMGHVRNYAMGDVVARYRIANGYNVLHPMGWDAFGLPAENAAIEKKAQPRKWTLENIQAMKDQFAPLGLSFDWSKEVTTCEPDYYEQQQRIFLKMLANDLVYRRSAKVNWDPVENTVLANEQVVDGRGWRSGAVVEQRELEQWFFRITKYGDDLLAALDGLDRWPEKVRIMQGNWIGKSQGARFRWQIAQAPDAEAVLRDETDGGGGTYAHRPDRSLHHAPRHAVRRRLPRARARSSADEGESRSRAPTSRSSWRTAPPRHIRSRHRESREGRHRSRHHGPPPVRSQLGAARLGRELRAVDLWLRRHLRLARRRPARHRVRGKIPACPSSPSCCPPATTPPPTPCAARPTRAMARSTIRNSSTASPRRRRSPPPSRSC